MTNRRSGLLYWSWIDSVAWHGDDMTEVTVPTAFFGQAHNHTACIGTAMHRAEAICAENNLRLTALRREVLELIWCSHKPAKAYDLLAALHRAHNVTAPNTVYRALDFLLNAGLVHRIESRNAFIGCDTVDRDGHKPKFLICRHCERVAEIPSEALDTVIATEARNTGFVVDSEVIEIQGLCGYCAADAE